MSAMPQFYIPLPLKGVPMTTAEALDELADILGAPIGSLTPETPLNTEGLHWDSMALLAYLAFLRFHFNKTLVGSSCAAFQTVADLLAEIPE
jgi:acyl carrier protein